MANEMKRILYLVFLCLSCLLVISGCKKGATGYHEVDFSSLESSLEFNNDTNFMLSKMTFIGDTAIFITPSAKEQPSLMMYYDKGLDSVFPLCGKPECIHNNKDCDAYCGYDEVLTVQYYDGKIYTVTSALDIVCMETDGTKHRKLRNIAGPEFPLSNAMWYFHCGYLFVQGEYNYVAGGVPRCRTEIRAYKLDDSSEYSSVFFNEYSIAEQRLFITSQPQKDHLFFVTCMKSMPGPEESVESFDPDRIDYHVMDWDLNTQLLTELFSFELPDEDPYRGACGIIYTDDGFRISCPGYLMHFSDQGVLEGTCRIDKDMELVLAAQYMISLGYIDMSWDRLRIYVQDYSDHILLDEIIKADNKEYGMIQYGVNQDRLFVMHQELGEGDKHVLGEYNLMDGSYQPVWSDK